MLSHDWRNQVMPGLIYIVQGFGPAPEESPLTVAARFDDEQAAQRHARVIGTFCAEVTIEARHEPAMIELAGSAQNKARTGNSGF